MRTAISSAACAALLCCGCSQQTRLVLSVPVTASTGQAITVSASQAPALAGAELDIPAGALEQDTIITLELGLNDVVLSPNSPAGPVAIWGPSGTRFSKPALMRLPFQLQSGQSAQNLFIDGWEEDGTHFDVGHSGLGIDLQTQRVAFNVSGFTTFQPGTASGTSCRSDSDCGAGEVCVNGVCEAPDDGGIGCVCANGQSCDANGNCNGSPDGGVDGGASCQTSADCPSNEVCNCGICEPQDPQDGGQPDAGLDCRTDQDCPSGQTCENGVCVGALDGGEPDAGLTCNVNQDCPSGETCVNGVCIGGPEDAGYWDAGANDGGAAPDAGQDCRTDTDCNYPYTCINGICQ
jgi:Cys-rich repeat protein